jgi:NAD(P)-dependent dehydrogenase (short-subunit alcohol dehydrogenase family)
MRGLNGKLILITGGAGDLGIATAKRLVEEGGRVLIADILDDAVGRQRADQVGAIGYLRFDQADQTAAKHAIHDIARKHGRLDVVIANAACVVRAPFVELSHEDWNSQIRLNLTGYFIVAQIAAILMQEQDPDASGVRGKILMTSSWVGQRPLPCAIAYVVSKAGVDALVQAAAQELSPKGIRVNAVAPGLVYSGLTKKVCDENPKFHAQLLDYIPLNELGTPEQIASAYAFLCSDESNYMTGQVLVVDGGCTVIKREGA